MNPESLVWLTARAGGLVAYLLLTVSVALGLLLSLGWRTQRWRRFVTNEVHRFVTLLALVFSGIHALALAVDPFIRFTPLELVVPFASHYRSLWVALGIVGAYLLAAVWLSEYLRPRIGYRAWRAFHVVAFAVYVLITIHGLATGSDSRTAWAMVLYGGSIAVVGALVAARLLPPAPGRRRPLIAALGLGLVLLGSLWAWDGPLQPGWNTIANDGRGSGGAIAVVDAPGPADPSPTPSPIAGPFSGAVQTSLAGKVAQEPSGDLRVDTQLSTPAGTTLTLVLSAAAGGSSTVTVTGPDGSVCQGPIEGSDDGTIFAACTDASGRRWALGLELRADQEGRVRGTLRASSSAGG